MRYQFERCVVCGTPKCAVDIEPKHEQLGTDGKYSWTRFWFCSNECYEKGLNEFLELGYRYGDTFGDSAEYKYWEGNHGHIEAGSEAAEYGTKAIYEAREEWRREKESARYHARINLGHRLADEEIHISEKESEQMEIKIQRLEQSIASKYDRDFISAWTEHERLLEKEAKEAERLRLEREENEKWEPKPFKL